MAGLYVHIPFCKTKCSYCDFFSYTGRDVEFGRYLAAVLSEISALGTLPMFETVFVGGGTPSLLPPDYIPHILGAVAANISPFAEITCEANPGSLSREHVRAWRAAGVNRLSLGAQAAQASLLHVMGRRHAWEDVKKAAFLWGEADTLSLDIIHGVPGQTPADWEDTLYRAAELTPGHISCYALTLEEGTPLYSRIIKREISLPSWDSDSSESYDAQAVADELLEMYGYERYEVSNYARPNRRCRHNMTYWTRGDYIGIGCAAHSFKDGIRSSNTPNLDEYLLFVEQGMSPVKYSEVITEEDAFFEEIMLGLRLTQGVCLSPGAFARYGGALKRMSAQGLVLIGPEATRVKLTPRGMDIMNAVLVEISRDE